MERDEHALRRKCEDLRLTLENRTRELAQSQELYSKLKQRVLLGQTQEIPPSVARARTPLQAPRSVDASHGQAQSQLPRPVLPVGARTGAPSYFPASPGFSKTQPVPAALVEWNRPAFSQRTVFPACTSEVTAKLFRNRGARYAIRPLAPQKSQIPSIRIDTPSWGWDNNICPRLRPISSDGQRLSHECHWRHQGLFGDKRGRCWLETSR